MLVERIGEAIEGQDQSLVDAVSKSLLPQLVEDWQLPAAGPLIARLDGEGLAAEIAHLGASNNFEAYGIAELVVKRARAVGAKEELRASIVTVPPSQRRDALLASTIDPEIADVAWLLDTHDLSSNLATGLLVSLLRAADDRQLYAILGQPQLRDEVLVRIEGEAPDLLERAVLSGELPIEAFVGAVGRVLLEADAATRDRVADKALRRCLPRHFDGDEMDFLTRMLDIVGEKLDAIWTVRAGLGRDVPSSVANRNMVVFPKCSTPSAGSASSGRSQNSHEFSAIGRRLILIGLRQKRART